MQIFTIQILISSTNKNAKYVIEFGVTVREEQILFVLCSPSNWPQIDVLALEDVLYVKMLLFREQVSWFHSNQIHCNNDGKEKL